MTADTGSMSYTTVGQRFAVTARTRWALADLVAEIGPQHLIITWPPAAVCISAADHRPSGHEAIICHVDGCPVFLDLRQLASFQGHALLVDIAPAGESKIESNGSSPPHVSVIAAR